MKMDKSKLRQYIFVTLIIIIGILFGILIFPIIENI